MTISPNRRDIPSPLWVGSTGKESTLVARSRVRLLAFSARIAAALVSTTDISPVRTASSEAASTNALRRTGLTVGSAFHDEERSKTSTTNRDWSGCSGLRRRRDGLINCSRRENSTPQARSFTIASADRGPRSFIIGRHHPVNQSMPNNVLGSIGYNSNTIDVA